MLITEPTKDHTMTPEQFTHWLQGYFDLSESGQMNPHQVQIVKDHLATVFNKVTPSYPPQSFPLHPATWGVTTSTQPATLTSTPTPGTTGTQFIC